MTKALEGVRVLDLTHAYNGPFCTTLLGDNGAEIIKIENPKGGDQCRRWIPIDHESGESGYFAFLNRNKKGITLNLKSKKGKDIFLKMVKEADVVVENFRFGVMDKLGLNYETLKKVNPQIIYASSSGFGQCGPLKYRPCYDIVAQAMGGMVNITGFKEGMPTKVGPSIADNVTGIYLCVGILMALYNREKTGVGQTVDVAMLDTIFTLLENAIIVNTLTGKIPERQGNIDPSIAPFDIYKVKDGYAAVGVGTDKLWAKFCETINKPELIEDPRFLTNELRAKNYISDLQSIIKDWMKDKTKKELEDLFDKEGIPCGPVLNMKEAIEHPQIQARDMMVHVEHPKLGDMYIQGVPIKLSKTPGSVDIPAPTLGQHNKEIYSQYGVGDEELKTLKEEGII